ncbi:MAG: OsmC family peroxiredoxin [Gammaproteobacteria bacterium]|jgi:putative redox protein|nr:OsmC family peroxiredoxin [Gammaproteobacteria bacterium]
MTQITATLTDGMVVSLSNGRHEWTADEPLSAGGTDTGPSPYELLLGSLAACTCATIAWYCNHKGLTLQSVSTSYEFSRVHAEDCEDCDVPDRGFIEQITSNVHIEGDFDASQQKRLAQIASRCPVHKTLAHGVTIQDNATFGTASG